MTNRYRSDKQEKFMLRLPDGMRELIKESSTKSGRSMNAEIVHRLRESFVHDSFSLPDRERTIKALKTSNDALEKTLEISLKLADRVKDLERQTSSEALEGNQ
jgi:hypothetical protein